MLVFLEGNKRECRTSPQCLQGGPPLRSTLGDPCLPLSHCSPHLPVQDSHTAIMPAKKAAAPKVAKPKAVKKQKAAPKKAKKAAKPKAPKAGKGKAAKPAAAPAAQA